MGLFALLLVVGFILVVEVLDSAITRGGVPWPISSGLHLFVAGIKGAFVAFFGIFFVIARGAISLFTAPARAFLDIVNSVELAIWRLGNAVRDIVYRAIPALWSGIISAVSGAVNNLVKLIAQRYAQAIAYANAVRAALGLTIANAISGLSALIITLQRNLVNLINQVAANVSAYALALQKVALAALGAVAADLAGQIAGLRKYLLAYIGQVAQWAVTTASGIAIDWARKYADSLLDAWARALSAATAIALTAPWPRVIDAIDDIVRALPDSLAGTLARVGAIPRAIPRDLAIAIGAVAAASAVAVDWVAKCGVPLCRNVLGFGDELAALEEELIIAELLEFIAAAIIDPHDAADDMRTTLVAPLSEVGRDFAGIVGTAA
jgi:hypothetical protein